MSYIIFIWDFFFFFLKELFLLFFFFFLFSCIACWAKSPILHFRACSVFYFFVGGNFFDREYEEGGDVRGCRHLVFFSYFFFLPWRREYEREKKRKWFLSQMSHQIGLGRTDFALSSIQREREKSPQLKRSADGSGWQNISTDGHASQGQQLASKSSSSRGTRWTAS